MEKRWRVVFPLDRIRRTGLRHYGVLTTYNGVICCSLAAKVRMGLRNNGVVVVALP